MEDRAAAPVPEHEDEEARGRALRRHERFAVDGEAEVMVASGIQLFRGRIADISLSGCFIETKLRLHMKIGTAVQMVFSAGSTTLRADATVRMMRHGIGAGFSFDTMSDYMRAGLAALIYELEGKKVPRRTLEGHV